MTLIGFLSLSLLGCSPQPISQPVPSNPSKGEVIGQSPSGNKEADYGELINKIEHVNKTINTVACKAQEGGSYVSKRATPLIKEGFKNSIEAVQNHKSIKAVQNHIPETWKDNSQEFIEASNIIYNELNINLKYLPPDHLPSVGLTGDTGTLNLRPITLKEFPNGGKIVMALPCNNPTQ
ncbi:MAG: hypothetical protein F6K47_08965 [Symploca sp. SIO2E6]|nr:hypothetical protein [Symploca sp. SIO2E6]